MLARLFLRSIETGQNVTEDFLSYAYRLAAQHGFRNCEYIPDVIWERATATFGTQDDHLRIAGKNTSPTTGKRSAA